MGKINHIQTSARLSPEALRYSRALLEQEVERLISLLDALDGDTDHEDVDEDSEPDADDEPDSDDEPWLGRLETISQRSGTYRLDWIPDGEVQLVEEWRP